MYPSVPFTRIRWPSEISWVACSTPTTAGRPYSLAITAPWVIRPPTSVTKPSIATNAGVQLGSVCAVSRIRPERILSLADELAVRLLRAHDLVEFGEPEVENIFLGTKHTGLHEALGLMQQRLLVHEVAADHVVLRILAVSAEHPDPVDHPLGLFSLPLAIRQGPQARHQLLFHFQGISPTLLEAPLAGARLEVLDAAEDHRDERGGAFAPAWLGDVDLADACIWSLSHQVASMPAMIT